MPDIPTGTVTFLFTDIEDGGAAGVGRVLARALAGRRGPASG
jgi:hypothetical protein